MLRCLFTYHMYVSYPVFLRVCRSDRKCQQSVRGRTKAHTYIYFWKRASAQVGCAGGVGGCDVWSSLSLRHLASSSCHFKHTAGSSGLSRQHSAASHTVPLSHIRGLRGTDRTEELLSFVNGSAHGPVLVRSKLSKGVSSILPVAMRCLLPGSAHD